MKRRLQHARASRSSEESEQEDDCKEEAIPPAKKLLKSLLEKEVQKAVRSLQEDEPGSIKTKGHRAASLIPEFDPDADDCTVQAWIRKIDQIGEIHGWNEATKSFHLQDKLRGQAKKWYNRLENYDQSWHEWKEMLLRAFPKHRDYGNMLEELIQRKKLPTETMTKYYQDKIAMCFRCKLSDSASVSCIIRGLPLSLQPNARAFQCQSPGELYEGFLCALDDYRVLPQEFRPQKQAGFQRPTQEKRFTLPNPETDPCPRCKKTGHLLRDCTQPDTRTCYKCGAKGHIALRCSMNRTSKNSSADIDKEINILTYNDIYKKVVKVNGVYLKAYIDTGSQVNVLNEQVSSALALAVEPSTVGLKGFSGEIATSLGRVQFELEIDGITLECEAYLSDIKMKDVNLLIGQPVINRKGMTLTVSEGSSKLVLISDSPLGQIEVVEEKDRFEVVTVNEERMLPGTSIVQVRVLGNKIDNDVVTPPRHYELDGVSYCLPATLLRGEDGYIKAVNLGCETIVWPPGVVLTRAESCEAPQQSQMCSGRMVPKILMNNGREMPTIALGTYVGMETDSGALVTDAVLAAIDLGYRHIDTASIYNTERQVGDALRIKMAAGDMTREELFVTTKLWNTEHKKEQVVPALRQSLKQLQLDYVDLYLMHWPMGLNEDYTWSSVDFMETWRGMEEAVSLGLTRAVGLSNYNQLQLERILREGNVAPSALQIEVHPQLIQTSLISFCRAHNIVVMGYSPLGALVPRHGTVHPGLGGSDPALVDIARKYGKSVAQIVLRWAVDRHVVPLPKSVNPKRLRENIDIFDFKLTEEEIEKINGYHSNRRFTLPSFWQDHAYYPFEKVDNPIPDVFLKKEG